jgi:hypothetical protein
MSKGRNMAMKALRVTLIVLSIVVAAFAADPQWKQAGQTIRTPWAKDVSPARAWPEYPRPIMTRTAWLNLNGLWEYAIAAKASGEPGNFEGSILVPFAVESALSGVGKAVSPDQALWYRRSFQVPAAWKGKRVLLHFGGVDWETTVYINGRQAGTHRGGYDPFTFDISDDLQGAGPQNILIRVWDPTNGGNSTQPRGKQVLRPGGIFYTAVTGIWQTVWLEPVPQAHIVRLRTVPDIDHQAVSVTAEVSGAAAGLQVRVEAREGKAIVVRGDGRPGQPVALTIPNPRLWSPSSPFLYDLQVTLLDAGGRTIDSVDSYFGMRKITVGRDAEGFNRLLLNNKPLFQIGPLDQGWWPDGLYTAPTDAALRYDLEQTKALGFNMLRKHVKVEPERLYYWADRLGLLVWQDMPSSNFNRKTVAADALADADRQWYAELKAMIDHLHNYPSIVMWVPFNEGWGQHDTRWLTEWIKNYDPSRLVNNASGWTDESVGDVNDIHSYPGPAMPAPESGRAVVLGEFGGLGLPVKGHLWKEEGNWGYRSFDDFESYRQKYADLIVAMYGLVKKGLAAAVYTQTTDCEIEVNGLMTYDRMVSKLESKAFATLNRGFLPPVLEGARTGFVAPVRVELQSADPAAGTRYTLDGTEPTERSPRYTAPITIDRDVTLRARNFWSDGTASVTIGRSYHKAQVILDAVKPDTLASGLAFEFYKSHWTQLPDFRTITPVRQGMAGSFDLECAQGEKSDFGLRFTGYIQVPKTDVYVFYVNSDDGTRLRIGGKDVVLNDGVHGMTEVQGEIALQEGWHSIELLYFQGTGGQGLQVTWEGPGFLPRPIPKEALRHAVTQAQR